MAQYKIKELAPDDRPREKLAKYGPEYLTDSELLAILIGSGTKDNSVLDIAQELIHGEGIPEELAAIRDVKELSAVKGLGTARASIILAALELGRRLAAAGPHKRQYVTSPEEGAAVLLPYLRYRMKERFLVVLLNSKNGVLAISQISEGSLNSSVVYPREVFAPAVIKHAAAILTAHNHPSGDPTPSKEDRELTAVLVKAGGYLGIPVLDHIIVGDGNYFSFKEHNYL